MSASILDRTRAFALIADKLSEAKQTEIAELLADKLIADAGGPRKPGPSAPVAALPSAVEVVDTSEHAEAAEFLVTHGYQGAELAKAAGRLAEWLKHHPNLTREAGMRVWLGEERAT
ncbi:MULTISPECIES: hypothetical protein [unclassified Microbacterium]|uniref:hypothetical protein n=1 Tax=unclassified Microbacterium TaxID=2609290 RepID=UPI00342450DC